MSELKDAIAPLGIGIAAELVACLIAGVLFLGYWAGLPS